MNKARRLELQKALDIVSAAMDEEQEAFDNLPESFQDGEKGQRMEEIISNLDECVGFIEDAIE